MSQPTCFNCGAEMGHWDHGKCSKCGRECGCSFDPTSNSDFCARHLEQLRGVPSVPPTERGAAAETPQPGELLRAGKVFDAVDIWNAYEAGARDGYDAIQKGVPVGQTFASLVQRSCDAYTKLALSMKPRVSAPSPVAASPESVAWGCDEKCKAREQGWPAPCFMYPDAPITGCSRVAASPAEPAPAWCMSDAEFESIIDRTTPDDSWTIIDKLSEAKLVLSLKVDTLRAGLRSRDARIADLLTENAALLEMVNDRDEEAVQLQSSLASAQRDERWKAFRSGWLSGVSYNDDADAPYETLVAMAEGEANAYCAARVPPSDESGAQP